MITRQQLKYIKSLQIKKYRNQAKQFLIEGEKSVLELIHSDFKINTILATKRFLGDHIKLINIRNTDVFEVDINLLRQAGTLKTNQTAIAVAGMPEWPPFRVLDYPYLPAFNFIQDPGNLGTILRICDWYGIKAIILSPDSVDCFNPKVIQASMGSFTRIRVYYLPFDSLITESEIWFIGTSPTGENIHDYAWPERAIIFFGNESRGLSAGLLRKMNQTIAIPGSGHAESLNVSVATGIVLDNLMRSRKS